MQESRDVWPQHHADQLGLSYRGPFDFVLREGRWFEPRSRPSDVAQGAPRSCFGNAILISAVRGWPYIEGYATHLFCGDVPVHHAWNLDELGNLVDVTWPQPGLAYLGVEFSVERADDATWNGDASVLDDFNRGWPLLHERWQGENFELEWPTSRRLELLRQRDREGIRALLESS